jgi:hypothetical protein
MNKFSKIAVFLIICTLFISCKDIQSNDLEFNPAEWKKADFRVRGRMYDSLLEQRLLLGRTRNEVIELLGKPDEEKNDLVKYAVDLGSIFESWAQRYFILITFDEKTQIVNDISLIDS